MRDGRMKHKLEITSLQNPKIKQAIKLRERRQRDEEGLFLIEGYRELKRAADAGVPIKELFICPEFFLGSNEHDLIKKLDEADAEIFKCAPKVFEKISYRDRPDGLLAIAFQMKHTLKDLYPIVDKKKDSLFIIAEAIEKPGNLGTILRSADAAGVDGVIVCDRCTDIYNPNVVRASVGTLFTMPVVEAKGSETLLWLQKRKIKVIASTPSAKIEFTDADMTGPAAIVVGTEQLGLSEAWLSCADLKVRIPMLGVADSLNVATATTLLLYEVLRQRRKSVAGPSFF
jgi:RNA methyltransferase, TrmH family